jgi:hypothetical protein
MFNHSKVKKEKKYMQLLSIERMRDWKLNFIFNYMKNLKSKRLERFAFLQNIGEILRQRKLFRIFEYWKLGIAIQRKTKINKNICLLERDSSCTRKAFYNWRYSIMLNLSMKRKVQNLLNKTHDHSPSLTSAEVQQQYFDSIQNDKERQVLQVADSLEERNLYSFQIKKFTKNLSYELDLRFPTNPSAKPRIKKKEISPFKWRATHLTAEPAISRKEEGKIYKIKDGLKEQENVHDTTNITKGLLAEKYKVHKALFEFEKKRRSKSIHGGIMEELRGNMNWNKKSMIEMSEGKRTNWKWGIKAPNQLFKAIETQKRNKLTNSYFTQKHRQMVQFTKQDAISEHPPQNEGRKAQYNYTRHEADSYEQSLSIPQLLDLHVRQIRDNIILLKNLPFSFHRNPALLQQFKTSNIRKNKNMQFADQNDNLSLKQIIVQNNILKLKSVFFNKWKITFLEKWIVNDFRLKHSFKNASHFIHTLKMWVLNYFCVLEVF